MGGAEGPAAKDPIPQRPHLFQQYPQHLYRANQHVGARVTVSGKRPSSDAAEPPLEIPPHGLGLVGCGDSGDGSGGTASGGDSLSSTPESSWYAELVGDCGMLPMGDVVVEVSRKVSVGSRGADAGLASSTILERIPFECGLCLERVVILRLHVCIFVKKTLR